MKLICLRLGDPIHPNLAILFGQKAGI